MNAFMPVKSKYSALYTVCWTQYSATVVLDSISSSQAQGKPGLLFQGDKKQTQKKLLS